MSERENQQQCNSVMLPEDLQLFQIAIIIVQSFSKLQIQMPCVSYVYKKPL